MKTFLKNCNILNIPLEDNSLVSINVCVRKWKQEIEKSEEDEDCDILFAGNFENSISMSELKNYFAKYGKIKDFKCLEKGELTEPFKFFFSCAYIQYVEKNSVPLVLYSSFKINEIFICPHKTHFTVKTEKNNLHKCMEEYYKENYDLYFGRKRIHDAIKNCNKLSLRKKIKSCVDEDGFTVVQGTSTAVEFFDSVFFKPTDRFNCLIKIKKQTQNKKVHENLYLFKSKILRKYEENIFDKKKSTSRKRRN